MLLCQTSKMGILKVVSVWCDRMNDCGLIIWGFYPFRYNCLIFVLLFIVAFSLGLVIGLKLGCKLCKNCHFCHFIIDCDFLCINKMSKLLKMWYFWFILWVSTGLDKGNLAVWIIHTLHTGYFRKFIPRFSDISRPLTKLLAHDCEFNWNNQCDISFQMMKDALCSALILKYPDTSTPYTLYIDISKYSWPGVLTQKTFIYGKW